MPGESKEAQDAKHVAHMRRTATDNPTSVYQPTGTGAGWGWGMAALDGKPFYTWYDVPRMIRDPRVRFLERMWRSPFQQAKWTVKASHPKVQQYVDSQLKKFWRESLPACSNGTSGSASRRAVPSSASGRGWCDWTGFGRSNRWTRSRSCSKIPRSAAAWPA